MGELKIRQLKIAKVLKHIVVYILSRPIVLMSVCVLPVMSLQVYVYEGYIRYCGGISSLTGLLGVNSEGLSDWGLWVLSATVIIICYTCAKIFKKRLKRVKIAALIALAIGLSVVRIASQQNQIAIKRDLFADRVNRNITLSGEIVRQPLRRHTDQQLVMKMTVSEEDPTEVLMQVTAPRFPRVRVGQVCRVSGRLRVPEAFDGFDYPRYLATREIFYQLTSYTLECVPVAERREGFVGRNKLFDFKMGVTQRIVRNLPEPQASLLAGIVFGDKRVFQDDFTQALRNTGTSHIIAASGYNVTLVILGVAALLPFVPLRLRLIVTLLAIWGFALIAGFEASIVRAALMGSVFLMAKLLKRLVDVHLVFIVSLAVFALYNPLIVYDVGFQLSASATAGLIYLLPWFENRLGRLQLLKGRYRVLALFRETVLPTLSATIATLPVSVSAFGGFSIVALPVNVVVLPVVESTLFLGLAAVLVESLPLGVIGLFVSRFLFLMVYVQLRFFEIVVLWAGSLSWAYRSVI